MGLLDSMVGSVLNAQQGSGQRGQGGLTDVLGGLLGQGQGGTQHGQGAGGAGLGALLPVVMGILANNDQGGGGLGGLMEKFNQAGLGDVLGSWIGTGQNAPISGEQLGEVLGGDAMGDLAARLGMNQSEAAGQLAQVLPGLIETLTPQGMAPERGFGNTGDLMGMLGGLLQQR
jgi:uncharacterized protein YidB (DUF937 family)